MGWIAERIASFFVESFPPLEVIAAGGPLGLLWAFLCLWVAGLLKRKKGLRTGYTRKIFHFLIFTTAAVLHAAAGTPVVCLFGGMTSIVLLYALLRGSGHLLYEGVAREKDAPHRSYFIVVPYFATVIGGIASNILFGEVAVVGYLVTGIGDAIGEPVGTRFGRHTYRVPSFRGVKTTRSLEGSAGVFLASAIAIVVAIPICPLLGFSARSLLAIPILAAGSTLLEAISPHGWDNATMQIVPAYLARVLL